MKTFISDLSKKEYPFNERVSAKTIRHSVLSLIQKDHHDFSHESYLSKSELNHYREKAIREYLLKGKKVLTELENTVLTSMKENTTLADKIEEEEQKVTLGQKIADKVATFGGSWTFIISFICFLLIWISINAFWLINKGFDPYPFILLNLILSCVAALQAPVIMMSQNRQEEKDRDRARKDYMINLKSELEIRTLQEKIDHFITDQQMEQQELQKSQTELLNEVLRRLDSRDRKD